MTIDEAKAHLTPDGWWLSQGVTGKAVRVVLAALDKADALNDAQAKAIDALERSYAEMRSERDASCAETSRLREELDTERQRYDLAVRDLAAERAKVAELAAALVRADDADMLPADGLCMQAVALARRVIARKVIVRHPSFMSAAALDSGAECEEVMPDTPHGKTTEQLAASWKLPVQRREVDRG